MTDYLFALTDGGGTVPPELGVARRLVTRGHRVRVLADASMASGVASVGALFLPWHPGSAEPPSAVAFRDWEMHSPWALARGMADHMIAGPAEVQARRLLDVVATDRPDLVVTSFVAFGAMAAADVAELPFHVLIPNIYPLPARGLPPLGTGRRPARTVAGHLRDRAVGAAGGRLLGRCVLPPLNALRTGLGVPPLRGMWDQVRRARRQLVLTARSFDFPAELDDTVRYVGPILDDPSWAEAGRWQPPPGEGPLALVAMSSTGQVQEPTVQAIVDALARSNVRGLVTTGPELDPARLRGGNGIVIVRSAPHTEVLDHVDLVITHGGHGTVLKSLVAGRPMLVLPHGRDQHDNAVRVTARGAGEVLRRAAAPARIAAATHRIIRIRAYRDAARRLGGRISCEMARSSLVAELEGCPAPA